MIISRNHEKSKKSAVEAFLADKDFTVEDMLDPHCGKPCNRSSLEQAGIFYVEIRYYAYRRVAVLRRKLGGEWK